MQFIQSKFSLILESTILQDTILHNPPHHVRFLASVSCYLLEQDIHMEMLGSQSQ